MLIRVTPGPGPKLWSHSRGPERATHCTDLSSAHLCACGACWGFCSGVNVLNHSSPWRAPGAVSVRARKLYIPTFLPEVPTDARRRLGIFLCPELLLSQLIYIRREWWSECSKSIFREQFFSPTTCLYTTSVTLLSLRPFFLVCVHTHSLTHTLILTHTSTPSHPPPHPLNPSIFLVGFSALPNESCHLRSCDLLWHIVLVWFISYGKWE